MSESVTSRFLHIGVCVADSRKSIDFYTNALGFTHERDVWDMGPPYDHLLSLPGARFSVHHVSCGDVRLELIGFPAELVQTGEIPRPMNQLGFTHVTLVIDNLDSACDRVQQWGGRVLSDTRVDSDYGPIVFCTDPDGTRIELMQASA